MNILDLVTKYDHDQFIVCPNEFIHCLYKSTYGVIGYEYIARGHIIKYTYYLNHWYSLYDKYFERITNKAADFQKLHDKYQDKAIYAYWVLKQFMQRNRYPIELMPLMSLF